MAWVPYYNRWVLRGYLPSNHSCRCANCGSQKESSIVLDSKKSQSPKKTISLSSLSSLKPEFDFSHILKEGKISRHLLRKDYKDTLFNWPEVQLIIELQFLSRVKEIGVKVCGDCVDRLLRIKDRGAGGVK